MKIILFGGSFDPISNYHIHIAKVAAARIDADIVIFMPSYFGRYGEFHEASPQERLQMCKLAIPDTYKPKYLVSDYELKQRENSSPYDTIEYLRRGYEGAEIFLLIGSDNLMTFSEWKNAALIKVMARIICYLHPEFKYRNLGFLADHAVIYLDDQNFERKAAEIRLLPQKNDLPAKVLEYINESGTYAKQRLRAMLKLSRYEHTLRVADTAVRIARYQAPHIFSSQEEINKLIADAYIAGLYHDVCKDLKPGEQIEIARKELKIEWWPHWKVLHGPVGAWWIKNKYFLENPDILRAVAEHTLPQPDAPILSKIIYLADHLEPKRLEYMSEQEYDAYWDLIKNNQFNQAFDNLYSHIKNMFPADEQTYTYPIKF